MSTVTHALPEPEFCNVCGSPNVTLESNSVIYGKRFGEWPYVWYCGNCKSSVGCHPGTRIPLGWLADRITKVKRVKAHSAFDELWKIGLMERSTAYGWLADQLGIEHSDCHISRLSKVQLDLTYELAIAYVKENKPIFERRNERKYERTLKRTIRERQRRNKNKFRQRRNGQTDGETNSE